MLAGRYAIAAVFPLALQLLLLLLPPPAAASIVSFCDGTAYPVNGTFQANLNLLAATLPGNASASPAGFATASVGVVPDQANGLALCRGDTNTSTCAACLMEAFGDAQKACPRDRGVTVYRDACVLRFASRQILDFLKQDQWLVSELVPFFEKANGSVNATDASFTTAVTTLFTALVDRAVAATNSTRKYFATVEMAFNPKIYGLAQCVPDLTLGQCRDCLGSLQSQTMARQMNGRPPSHSAWMVWCFLRYSVSPVYDGRAMLQLGGPPEPAPTLSPATPESRTGRIQIVPGILVGIVGYIVLEYISG